MKITEVLDAMAALLAQLGEGETAKLASALSTLVFIQNLHGNRNADRGLTEGLPPSSRRSYESLTLALQSLNMWTREEKVPPDIERLIIALEGRIAALQQNSADDLTEGRRSMSSTCPKIQIYVDAFRDPKLGERDFEKLSATLFADKTLSAADEKEIVSQVTGVSKQSLKNKTSRREMMRRWYPNRDREKARMLQLTSGATRF